MEKIAAADQPKRTIPATAQNLPPLYKQIYIFLGKPVTIFLAVGILIGVSLFLVEMAFAYSLQIFLICVHVMPAAAAGGRFLGRMQHWDMPAVLAFMFVVGLLRAAFTWAQMYTQACASIEFTHLQRSRIVRNAFHADAISTYDVMVLYEGKTGCGAGFITQLQGLAVVLTSNLMVLGSLLWMSPILSLAVLVVMAALFLPMRIADRMIIETSKAQAKTAIKITQKIIVSVRNLLLIQIYGTQRVEEAHAQSMLSEGRDISMRMSKITGIKYALPQFVGMILICLITLAARDHARMAPGTLVSFFYLLVRLLAGLSGLNISLATISGTWSETAGLFRWWRDCAHDGFRPEVILHAPVLKPRARDAQPVGWKLERVTYSYGKVESAVINDLDLTIDPGQTLAITGPSGSGKTTLLNVLLGNYIPNSGTIEALLHNGERRPLRPFRDELLPLVGYVGPESFMIEGSIRENLYYGLQHNPTDEEILKALSKAECDFVRDMPGMLEYALTEQGQGLSAGQKQRLALARALLRRPKIMILDEATSNLDNETEDRLVETFARLKGEMTIIATTHRQALLKIADQRLALQ